MAIQIPTVLLDGTVLASLEVEDMYGYTLTKAVQAQLAVSESTMYPVLRRLQKNGDLETYDQPFEGRMRRYYRLTDQGVAHFQEIRSEWLEFQTAMNRIMGIEHD
jgi:PadR family transcriptional regulator PadR